MDEQLAQNQTIEALRHQVETSDIPARDAQASLRAHQEQQLQQSRMPPPTNYPIELVVPSVTLLFVLGCIQESYMDRVTTMWDH